MANQPQEGSKTELYTAHQKIYPREASGKFNRLRVLSALALLGIFYATPLLQWDGETA